MSQFNYELSQQCPVCEAPIEEQSPLLTLTDSRVETTLPSGKLEVYYAFCQRCGHMYHNPRFDDETWDAWYTKYYDDFVHKDPHRRSEDGYGRQFVVSLGRALSQGAWLADHLPKVTAHLNIGCQMDQLQKEVYHYFGNRIMWGTEKSEAFRTAAVSEGACIVPSEDDIPQHLRGLFDFISISHVLEHFNDPEQFLRKMRSFCADDAYIFIEVPNQAWPGAMQISHPQAFSKWTLEQILKKTGWEVVKSQYNSRPYARWGFQNIRVLAKKIPLNGHYRVPKRRSWRLRFSLGTWLADAILYTWNSKWIFGNKLGAMIFVDLRIHPDAIQRRIIGQARQSKNIRQSPIRDAIELYSGGKTGGREIEDPPSVRLVNRSGQ